MSSPFSALKSFTNSGQFGGNAGPATTGMMYGGGATTAGVQFGNSGLSGWWLIVAALIGVVGVWLFK
ncbi:hypothetical protein [Celerinatantimonas sp. MCCC 1A17872]|uniref:hypothetical protein n=1 Tax=Celerinatantimonas sp. MCCC 1A17872 TaxID=3177514 RepID=UPI0038C5874E